MEHIIIDYIGRELITDPEILPLHADTPLMDSNIIDSVAFLNLVLFLEEQFGITITDTDLTRQHFETVEAICAYVRSHSRPDGQMAS